MTVWRNTAQRLGLDPEAKLLIIHADDLALSHSVNTASTEALANGVITSASIMVPCPWFPEIAALAREHPEWDLGLHLTLTCERQNMRWRPVSPANRVPNLFDDDGYLWKSERQVAAKASPAEIETELRTQIERALSAGITPTHFDNHAGVPYTRSDYFETYMRLGTEYGVPLLVVRPTPEVEACLQAGGLAVTGDRLRRAEAEGSLLLDDLITSTTLRGKTFEERRSAYHEVLRNLKPGVSQIIVHVSMDDAESRAITRLAPQWYADFRVFTDPSTAALIEDLGIRLTNWREVAELAAELAPAAPHVLSQGI